MALSALKTFRVFAACNTTPSEHGRDVPVFHSTLPLPNLNLCRLVDDVQASILARDLLDRGQKGGRVGLELQAADGHGTCRAAEIVTRAKVRLPRDGQECVAADLE